MSADPATAARRAAYEVLRRTFEHDAWTDRVLASAAERHGLAGRERAQAQRLAYGAVQRRGTCDHFAARLAGREVESLDPPVRAALRLGLFELLFSAEVAEHAAVDSAVELAKRGMRRSGGRRAAAAAGLVNAVLRRAAEDRDELLAGLADREPAAAAVAHSVPEWLAAMWWRELGADEARSLLRSLNEPAEIAARVNPLRATPEATRARLEAAGEPVRAAKPIAGVALPGALVWAGPLGPAARGALASGELFAQSRAAQAVTAVLGARSGERLLDLCAGPGVKTTALAAAVGSEGEVVAVERDPGRARQVEELCARAGARNVEVRVADAATASLEGSFDRVLVDPPCSDLGTLASRPDLRWRKDPESIERLAALQPAILDRGLEALGPGGTLVYSTCTISRRENHEVIAASRARDWSVVETRPDRDGTDGFFIARTVAAAG